MGTHLHKKALRLSYFTVSYNILEGLVSIIGGHLTGSIALVGFGLDSFIESLSGSIMIWRFWKLGQISKEEETQKEEKAQRWIGYTFFVFGAYVAFESAKTLLEREAPTPSLLGIIIAVVSIVVMLFLFQKKSKTGKELGSQSLVADARQTLACEFLSVALLAGTGLNYWFGLWWADPVAGLIIVAYLFKEGYECFERRSKF